MFLTIRFLFYLKIIIKLLFFFRSINKENVKIYYFLNYLFRIHFKLNHVYWFIIFIIKLNKKS